MAQQERRRILFVGGVAPNMNENMLFQHFSHFCGLTKAKIMREKKTRESKGYAYITVADPRSVQQILSTDHFVAGRKLDVQLATSKGEKREWKVLQRCRRVYAVGLPPETTNEQVAAVFARFGQVRNAFIIREHESRIKKEYAYIQFEETDAAELALSSVISIHGKVIACQPYWSRHELKDGNKQNSFANHATSLSHVSSKNYQSRSASFPRKENKYRLQMQGPLQDSARFEDKTRYQEAILSHYRLADNSPSNYRFNLQVARPHTLRSD